MSIRFRIVCLFNTICLITLCCLFYRVLKETLADLTSWINGYISNQDGLEIKSDCRIHGVFYSVCQALFYLIAFRHKDLVNQNKGDYLHFIQLI